MAIRFGVIDDPQGPSARFWAVAPITSSVDDVLAALPTHFFEEPEGYSSGPGRRFADRMRVQRSRTRILLTQLVGLDV